MTKYLISVEDSREQVLIEQLPFDVWVPEAGVYHAMKDATGNPYMVKSSLSTRNYIPTPDTDKILDRVKRTFHSNKKQVYEDFGLHQSLNLLLYGPPGTGKTTVIRKLSEDLIRSHDAIVFKGLTYPNNSTVRDLIKHIRKLEGFKDRLFILLVEDVDPDDYQDSGVLSFLDGQDSLPNILTITTTNHIEKFPANLVNRPGRFDKFEVGYPTEEMRRTFLQRTFSDEKLKKYLPQIDIEEVARSTEGLVFDHLVALIKFIFVYEMNLQQAITAVNQINLLEDEEDED